MAGQVFDNRQLRGEHCWLVSPTVLAIEQGTPHKMTMIRRTVIVRKGRGKGKPPKLFEYSFLSIGRLLQGVVVWWHFYEVQASSLIAREQCH